MRQLSHLLTHARVSAHGVGVETCAHSQECLCSLTFIILSHSVFVCVCLCRIWNALTDNYGKVMPVNWKTSHTRSLHLPSLNLVQQAVTHYVHLSIMSSNLLLFFLPLFHMSTLFMYQDFCPFSSFFSIYSSIFFLLALLSFLSVHPIFLLSLSFLLSCSP